MEDKIREYEEFIEKRTKEPIGLIERVKLTEYHNDMLRNFQHERLIHLIVMFFFVAVGLVLIAFLIYELVVYGVMLEMLPFYILTALVIILSGAYIKHYYFLENHIQALYKYNKILRLGKNK